MDSLQEKYSLSSETFQKAFENLKNKTSLLLVTSGKMGSGKDTVTPLILDKLGYTKTLQSSFATSLKEEIDEVIKNIQESNGFLEAYRNTLQSLNPLPDPAESVVRRLYEPVKNGEIQSSKDRTPDSRYALQHWGTEVRRAEDDDYWVKKALHKALTKISEGYTVYLTDARFVNEVESSSEVGAFTLRLDVSPEVQQQRIYQRDKIIITDEMRQHASEVNLDDYDNFSMRIKTDTLSVDGVVERAVRKIKDLNEKDF